MARYRSSKIVPVILVGIIIIIVIVAIVSIVRGIANMNATSSSKTDTSVQTLLDTSEGHSVMATVRGPIVADEDFHSYSITISPDQRNLTTYSGYNNTPVATVTLPNSVAAYGQFVNALNLAHFANGTPLTGEANNLSGRCATGDLYDFQIITSGTVAKELWTSTCSGSRGSLDANLNQVLNLFQAQIPDAQTDINNIGLK